MNDLQTAAIKGVSDVVQQVAKDLLNKSLDLGLYELGKLSVEFEYAFTKVLERQYRSLCKIKTLVNPSVPVAIEAIYVTPDIEINFKRVSGKYFVEAIDEMKLCVVTALAGSGKSVFMKRLFIRYFKEDQRRIPVFVELRLIAEAESLKSFILKSFNLSNPNFDSALFEYSLSLGRYAFLLDGFDEISSELRTRIANEIVEVSAISPDNVIIVTSRPDSIFHSWQSFYQAKVASFSKEQAIELISKLPFRKDKKKAFIERINLNLFDSHEAYLSNPLLCTIMLLTYNQKGEIPSETSVFFKLAFEALLFRHDTQKAGVYKRAYKVTVGAEKFTDICSTFSAFSYFDFGSSISKEDAIQCAQRALSFEKIDSTPENLLFDLCTSLSIAIEEGGQISYIHRSFQEYLTAVFLASRELAGWADLVGKIHSKRSQDTVITLLAQINPDRFRVHYVWPKLKQMIQEINTIDMEKNPLAFFELFYFQMGIDGKVMPFWTIQIGSDKKRWIDLLSVIERVYGVMKDDRADYSIWHATFLRVTPKSNLDIEYSDGILTSIEVKKMNNNLIRKTPLHAYLRRLKDEIIKLETSFQQLEKDRAEMLSKMII